MTTAVSTTAATAKSAVKTNGSSRSHASDTVRLAREKSQLRVMKTTARLNVTGREQRVKRDLDHGWLQILTKHIATIK